MIAKNTRICPVLYFDGVPQKQLPIDARAMILPQQIVLNPMQIQGEIVNKMLKGQACVKLDVTIDYVSGGQKYFYKGTLKFFSGSLRWIIQDSDAN